MSHINQTTANESTSEDFRGSVSEKNDDTSEYISVPANSPANSGSHTTNAADNEHIQQLINDTIYTDNNEIFQQFAGKDVDLRKLNKDDYCYADLECDRNVPQQQPKSGHRNSFSHKSEE